MGEQPIASTTVTQGAIAIALDFDGSLVALDLPNLLVDLLRNHGNQAATGEHPDNALDARGKKAHYDGEQASSQYLDDCVQ